MWLRSNKLFWTAAVVFGLLSAVFLVIVTWHLGGSRFADATDDIGELVAALAGAALCGMTAVRTGQRWRGWGLIAWSCAAWAAGEVAWCYYDLVSGTTVPFPSLADVGFLAAIPLLTAGLLSFPGIWGSQLLRVRGLLDGLLVGIAMFFSSWVLVLQPVAHAETGGIVAQLVSLAYPASDVAIASLLLLLITRLVSNNRVWPGLVFIGFLGFVVADSTFSYLQAQGHYGTGAPTDVGWVAGYFLVGLGGLWAWLHPQQPAATQHRQSAWGVLGPYAALALAGATAIWAALAHGALNRSEQVLIALLVVTLSARQALALYDNMQLTGQLETKVQHQDAQLERKTLYDDVTGLGNRVLLNQQINALADQQPDDPIGVLYVRLYGSGRISGLYGQQTANQIVNAVASRLRAAVRSDDIVARVGTDEFAVMLPGQDSASVQQLAQRVAHQMSQPAPTDAGPIRIQVAVGAACGINAQGEKIVRDAGLAMHAARINPQRNWETYSNQLYTDVLEDMRLELELGFALQQHQLVLHYQPLVDITTERISDVEALVRWEHPRFGLTGPDRFIPIAERTGLIIPLGAWVLRQALTDIKPLHVDGHPLRLAVNVSAHQLADPSIAQLVTQTLTDTGFAPSRLTLEVTESAITTDTHGAAHTLNQLRQLGIQIAMDDFGTGYSSLAALRQLPIDIIKIDKSFVTELADSQTSVDMVRNVLQLAADLKLRTVAEGVEHNDQLELLRQLGCDTIQGYLFARPQPLAQLSERLNQQPALHTAPALQVR